MAYVTRHAKQRTKERVGIPKRAAVKNANRALEKGIKHSETSGGLHRYVAALYWREQTANNIRIYGEYVYIFHDSTLITVFIPPQKYRKAANQLQKNREVSTNDV